MAASALPNLAIKPAHIKWKRTILINLTLNRKLQCQLPISRFNSDQTNLKVSTWVLSHGLGRILSYNSLSLRSGEGDDNPGLKYLLFY